MHIKKTKMPTTWPVPRKGKKKRFIAVPSHSVTKGISVLFLLRDVLKIARTRKEARHMTLNEMVKVDNKVRKDENFPVQVRGILSLDKAKLNYRLEIFNKKFRLVEISEKEAKTKIVKIVGKTILSGNKIQMNLDDGHNIIGKNKFSVGDSVVLNTEDGKIIKVLPLKIGARVEIISGKHSGEEGELIEFEKLVRGKNCKIKLNDKVVSLPYNTILVIE